MNFPERTRLFIAQASNSASEIDTHGALENIKQTLLDILVFIQDKILFQVGGGLIVLSLIFAGIKYITGDPKGGKTAIIAAITGTVIVVVAYALIGMVCTITGSGCA